MLDLSWNGFEDDGARALCDSMRVNNTLTELNIRNNRISTVGAAHIARGLEGNNTLEVLKVSTVYRSLSRSAVFACSAILKLTFFRENYIYDFQNDINYSLDIWDFFRHI